MTRDQLFKLIAENSTSFMKEQMLRDAVDLYTEALIAAKPNVSGSLPPDEDDGWMYCPNCGRVKIQD